MLWVIQLIQSKKEVKMLPQLSKEELEDILRSHRLWLGGDDRGRRANLSYTDLRFISLRYADLQYADLQGSDLRIVDLQGANLEGANLEGTDLRGANLRDTCLQFANLKNIKFDYRTIGIHPAPEGDLIGWGKENGVIIKLLIPSEAKRSCATTRRHRAEYAKVLRVEGIGYAVVENAHGITIYKPGIIVQCHEWDSNRWNECGGGIHFFLTREEAESY